MLTRDVSPYHLPQRDCGCRIFPGDELEEHRDDEDDARLFALPVPTGQIKFAEFTGEVELSPNFTATLDAALAKATLAEKREALDALFNEYGHVFRKQFLVGGRLSVKTLETYSRTVSFLPLAAMRMPE